MLARDYAQEILWSFRKQKLRTALTSTGIAIGAFAIAIMVGLGQGVQSYIENQVMAFGSPRVVVVFPESARMAERFLDQIAAIGKPAWRLKKKDSQNRRQQRGGLWITPEQVAQLKKLEGVESVAPLTWLEIDGMALAADLPPEELARADQPFESREPETPDDDTAGQGASNGGASGSPASLIAAALGAQGRPPANGAAGAPASASSATGTATVTPAEEFEAYYQTDFAALATHPLVGHATAGRLPLGDAINEVIIAPHYAESYRLAPEALVGREVVIRVPKLSQVAQRFLFRDPSQFKDEHRLFRARVVGLAERSPASRAVYASLALGREMARYPSQNPDILSDQKIGFQAHVRVAETADAARVKEEIRKLGLVAKSVEEQLADVTRSFLVVKLALSLFGLIAVLVATLGIANTLLMAISERTREIGVMKALGATEATIRRMFATEAAAIGLVGGVLGVLSAVGLGLVLNVAALKYLEADSFNGFRAFVFPWWLVLGAVGFSVVVGALAGLYPANRAARLDPIEALRYE